MHCLVTAAFQAWFYSLNIEIEVEITIDKNIYITSVWALMCA